MRWISNRVLAVLCVATTLAAAGCGQSSSDKVATEIGYMPILPDAQLFVAMENGDIAGAGIDPKLVSFQNGPAIVQASGAVAVSSGPAPAAIFSLDKAQRVPCSRAT